MAGFWNSHVHLMTPPLLNAAKHSDAQLTQELTQMLTRWGITTVFDIASQLTNTNEIVGASLPAIIGPTILTVGDPLSEGRRRPIYVRFIKDNGFPDEEWRRAVRPFVDLPMRARRFGPRMPRANQCLRTPLILPG